LSLKEKQQLPCLFNNKGNWNANAAFHIFGGTEGLGKRLLKHKANLIRLILKEMTAFISSNKWLKLYV